MIPAPMLHFLSAGLAIGLAGLGCAIGLGTAGKSVLSNASRQPLAGQGLLRALIIGFALIESSAIIALVATLWALSTPSHGQSFEQALASSAGLLSVGITAFTIGIASSFVVKAAAQAISRVPLVAAKITTFMMITQSIIEAPVLFTFVTNVMIRSRVSADLLFEGALALCAAACCICIGSIGPAIGQSMLAKAAVEGIGTNYRAQSKIGPFALLIQAIIETPILFCLLISLLIIRKTIPACDAMFVATKACIAALTMSIGSIGGAIALGFVGSKSCQRLAVETTSYATIMRLTLLSAAFIESCIIYVMMIAMILLTR
ncbi:hypothetical protein EBZ39_08590 [bacterium]|nr:hypothetical protein [bacterium]